MSDEILIPLWAAAGNVAVELIRVLNYFEKRGSPPKRYRNKWFWVARLLMVPVSVGLAHAFEASNPVVALYIGAAAPAIMKELSTQGVKVSRDRAEKVMRGNSDD